MHHSRTNSAPRTDSADADAEVELLRARLAELEDRFDEAVQAAKLQALYNFAYGISHMINNPLANIATRAQTLARDEQDPDRRKKLATINQQAFRAHEMIADLMFFARPPRLKLQTVDLVQLARQVVAQMSPVAEQQGTRLAYVGDDEPRICAVDAEQLASAVKAIVQNALEAVRRDGSVALNVEGTGDRGHGTGIRSQGPGARSQESEQAVPSPHFFQPSAANPQSAIHNPQYCLWVADTGPGIEPEHLPHLFDPYFSGREAGRGLGLGLSKAWRIVEQHGGRIEATSPPAGGARFSIVLPERQS